MVFVRALINPHGPSGRLLSEDVGRFALLISTPTAHELLEVIQRPELTRKYRGVSRIRLQQVINLLSRAEIVDLGAPAPMVRDPKDDGFVATALAGHADFIVSEDKDLLDLREVAGIPILDTRTFIERLESG